MGVDGIGGPRGPFTPPGVGGAAAPASGVRVQGDAADPLASRGPHEAAPSERVGEAGGAGNVAGAGSVGGAGNVARSGDVAGVGAASAAEVERAQLMRGELTLEQYLELQVEHATGHLADQAPAAVLEEIRGALRQELASDPVLVALTSRLGAG